MDNIHLENVASRTGELLRNNRHIEERLGDIATIQRQIDKTIARNRALALWLKHNAPNVEIPTPREPIDNPAHPDYQRYRADGSDTDWRIYDKEHPRHTAHVYVSQSIAEIGAENLCRFPERADELEWDANA